MQREVLDDGVRQVRRLLRVSETNAEDSDNAEAKHSRAAVKVFFILFECAKRRVIKATVRRIRCMIDYLGGLSSASSCDFEAPR
jgi:hypothetical protein